MPRLEYFLAAESISIDQATNRVSLFNVIDELGAPGFPIWVPTIYTVACLERAPGDEQVHFQAMIRLSGAPVGPPRDHPVNFVFGERIRMRLTHLIQAAQLVAPGTLVIELL